jgi:hypothetical protein
MPMISSAHKTLVHYPDDTSRVITLHVRPLEADVLRQRHYTEFGQNPTQVVMSAFVYSTGWPCASVESFGDPYAMRAG